MKKRGGILAFILYLAGVLGAFILLQYLRLEAKDIEGSALLGYALAAIIMYYIVLIPFAVLSVIKLLNILTGWKLFAILCAVLNVLAIVCYVYLTFAGFNWLTASCALGLILALISEIKGLRSV